MRGVPRPEWDVRVSLSAAKRLVSYAGLDVNVWGHASARVPGAGAGEGLPHPCVSEGSDPSEQVCGLHQPAPQCVRVLAVGGARARNIGVQGSRSLMYACSRCPNSTTTL